MVATHDGPEKSSGIISGVFNFVTREIGSFVTAAAGGSTSSIHPASESSTTQQSRSKPQRKQRAHDEPYNTRRRKEKPRQDKTKAESRLPGKSESRRPQEPISPEPLGLPSLQFRSKRPSRNIPERLTMPGSLFPRSPSLMPGGVEVTPARQPMFRVLLPPRTTASTSSKSSPQQRRRSPPPAEDDTSDNPFRPPSIPSVKDAVSRFRTDDADPSLLLPSPHHSPHRLRTVCSTPSSSPPKFESAVDAPNGNDTPRIPYAAKGKGRAHDVRDVSPPMQLDELHVRGKEEELLAAKEKQRRNESHREEREMTHPPDPDLEAERKRDKEQIKCLEAEIMRLKEELSKRIDGPGQVYNRSAPPPPPPPPPPPTTALRIPIHLGIHDPEVLFASARAALKPAGTPVEAQINPVVFGGKRKGQPTVGVPPEKMAAFLSEMKTVKLRRVHTDSSSHLSGSTSSAAARLNMSFDSATLGSSRGNLPALRLSSSVTSGPLRPPPGLAWKVGEKRKRDPRSELQDVLRASKRRSMGIPAEDGIDDDEHQSAVPNTSTNLTRSWPSVSTEPELTTATPSLCSDGRDDEDTALTSPDDQPPSTPPMNHNASTTPAGDPYNHPPILHPPIPIASAPTQQELELELELEWDDYRARTPPPNPSQKAFLKRPPMSPLPQPTPRRPMPPKLKRSSRVVARADDDVEPPSSNHEYDPDGDISRSLEAELRKVHSRSQLSLEGQGDDDPELVLESGVYVGVGTRSKKKGFMARGGAGGPPVLMGEGYVEGVELSDEEEYGSRPVRRTFSRSRSHSRQGYSAIPTKRKI